MGYYIDFNKITLDKFKMMLESTYLLPSQQILKDEMDNRFEIIKSQDINNLEQLQQEMKNKNKINSFSKETSLPVDYLTVLRRVINSYHPPPRKIKDFMGLSKEIKDKLENIGIKNTPQLYDKVTTKSDRNALKNELNVDDDEILLLAKLADVSRLRYVNPAFATLLVNSDYDTVINIKNADYLELYKELVKINEGKKFYKGRINLKDIKFLVNDTKHLPLEVEY